MTVSSSRLQRALPASFFLALGAICFYFMDILSLVMNFPSPSATGFIEWSNGKVPILQRFHWIPFLDEIFRDVTIGFAPSSFGYDDVSRWQVTNFMTDAAILYLVWGLESLRPAAKGTPVWYSQVWATVAQLGGGGVIVPIYYFAYVVFGPSLKKLDAQRTRIQLADGAIWMLLIVACHILPAVGFMFDSTFEGRHWWTWFWQLHPLRISIGYYGVLLLRKILPLPKVEIALSYQTSVRLIATPFIALSVFTYFYTAIYSPYPLSKIFVPQPLVDDTWGAHMQRTLQFDQLFIAGTSVLWAFWGAIDRKGAGWANLAETAALMGLAVLASAGVGMGSAFGIVWLLRENFVVEQRMSGDKDVSRKE